MINGISKINKDNINTKEYWNERFVKKETNAGTSALESILEWLDNNFDFDSKFNVLDIGSGPCRPGSFLQHIKEKYSCNCFLLDISSEICDSWKDSGILSKCSFLPNIDFEDNMFNLILCSHVLEHVDDIENSVLSIQRVLKPGGIAIINSPIGIGWGGEKEHVWVINENVDFNIGEIIDSFPGNQYNSLVQIYKKGEIYER